MLRTYVACAFIAACSSPAPQPTTPTPPPTGSDTPAPAPTPTTQGLGEKCGEADACPAGQTCQKYYGIAGPKGPQFSSCEISCADGAACPDGTKCITIADGPGQVCRP